MPRVRYTTPPDSHPIAPPLASDVFAPDPVAGALRPLRDTPDRISVAGGTGSVAGLRVQLHNYNADVVIL